MDLSLGEYAYKKKPSVYAIESSASENEDKPPAEIEGKNCILFLIIF